MRIEGQRQAGGVGRQASARGAAGETFRPEASGGAARSGPASTIAAPASLDAILALQSVGTATERRRRTVRRGRDLLDTLERLRADLLVGQLSPERLDHLKQLMATAEPSDDRELAALMADIELRVAVELAKRGR